MPTALEGMTVLELGTGPAAALAAMQLADHGARVIRIVAPGQSHLRSGGFVVWDRGKECAAVDLGAAMRDIQGPARADLVHLVRCADVLIEDFAPSAPEQSLVERGALARLNPRLVSCSITAYGNKGPWKDDPPIEDIVLARVGVLSGMPGFRPAPVHVVHPLPSVGAGLLAALGIASVLLAREETGRGRALETSLFAGTLLYQSKVIGEKLAPHVFQTHPAGSAPFYSVYRCADDKWLQLGCVHAAFIATAAKLFGIGDLIKEPRFDGGRGGKTPADDAELRTTVARILATRPSTAWAAAFEEADVPFAPARETEEGLEDPQVRHNEMVVTLQDPAVGPLTQMGVAIQMSGTPGRVPGPRPTRAVPVSQLQGLQPVSAKASTKPADGPDAPPLAGVRILEITNLIAGPTAGRLLADLGADVVKLEPPAGDMSRPIGRTYFYSVNFNKRSVCVDTSTAEGKSVVQRIAANSDALIANLRPQATARMGIGAKVNPRLIETHMTGYGWTGPYSKRPGIDPLAQAYMGLERAQGGPENPPVFPAQLAPTDFTTGAKGALGTVLALLARRRTGIVQRVDCNLLSGGIMLSSAWFTRYAGRPVRALADKDQHGLSPFHRLYRLADGWIYIVAETQEQQSALCRLAGQQHPGSIAHAPPAKVHPNASPFAQELAAALAKRSLAEVAAALQAAGVPAGEVRDANSSVFLSEPQAVENDLVTQRAHPTAGALRIAWQWIGFHGTAPTAGRATPLLGEHSQEVMAEAGIARSEAEKLVAAGIVRVERPKSG